MSTRDPAAIDRLGRGTPEASTDPEVISQQIDLTRDAMSDTLDELQRRLEPEQVTNYLKDVTHYAVLELKDAVRELSGQARDAIRRESVQGTTTLAPAGIAHDQHAEPLGGATSLAYPGEQGGLPAAAKAEKMTNEAQSLWKKINNVGVNPLAMGVVGLALGGLVGAVAPRTKHETEVMGDARDRVMNNVQGAAARTMETVRTAAVDTGSAVLKEATGSPPSA